jgi:hypothetical protein
MKANGFCNYPAMLEKQNDYGQNNSVFFQAACHSGRIFFNTSTVLDNKKDRSTMT